jgi:DNA-binding transcriptional LysR family regulator
MSPDDLASHTCIVQGARRSNWTLTRRKQTFDVRISPKYIVSDMDAAQALAQAGAGICLGSVWNMVPDLETGKLISLLPEFTAPDEPLYMLYPHGRQLAPRVRHFLEFAMVRLRAVWAQVSSNRERLLADESAGMPRMLSCVVPLAANDSMSA